MGAELSCSDLSSHLVASDNGEIIGHMNYGEPELFQRLEPNGM